jgi:hypothetical protein
MHLLYAGVPLAVSNSFEFRHLADQHAYRNDLLKPWAVQFGKLVRAARKGDYQAYTAALGAWNADSALGMYELLKADTTDGAGRALRCFLYTQASVFPPHAAKKEPHAL